MCVIIKTILINNSLFNITFLHNLRPPRVAKNMALQVICCSQILKHNPPYFIYIHSIAAILIPYQLSRTMHTKVEVNFSVVKIPVSPGTTLQVPPEPPAVVKLTLRLVFPNRVCSRPYASKSLSIQQPVA